MKHLLFFPVFFLPILLAAQTVVTMKIDGNINPVAASFIHRGIAMAATEKAECLVIYLNTPGGLLKSTRVIVSDILTSPVPVVVYVAPAGASAGSAGVFITMAANIAAMAPGTNIGAAHPVGIGQGDTTMQEKVTNDAAAFIRAIAEKRNRNGQWGEEAVRNSRSITENEALEQKVTDLVAPDLQSLLQQIDGKTIELPSGTVTLHTKSSKIISLEMGMGEKVLDVLSDPNIAYALMLLGFFGVLFELYNPGAILPGIVGAISLVLAFYSLHTLPVNYAGLALIVFAIILFLLEIKIVSHGLLAIGGAVSLLLGSMMLVPADPGFNVVTISRSVIISSVFISTLFFLVVLGFGLKAQRAKPVTGIEGLLGDIGESLDELNPVGRVRVHGETWNAVATTGKIAIGEKVRVVEINNLELTVEPV
ncbi:nodulation protein NfeD [Chitinophaga sp. MM2321]|uniref:NfeD family protein n=1 Tax=Chitinophaga sp. MM2321 TaxID=3137178 RepID=UPI0032D587F9